MNKKEGEENKKFFAKKDFYFILIPFLFSIFFALNIFHGWANSTPIKLHFCDHFFCIIYSLIWLIIGLCNSFFYYKHNKKPEEKDKEKKNTKKKIILFCLILVIGIILMNITFCNSGGKMMFGLNDNFENNHGNDNIFSEKGEDFNDLENHETNLSNPDEPYDSEGNLKSPICLDIFVLRTYTQLSPDSNDVRIDDVNCSEVYTGGCCIEGECVEGCFGDEEVSCETMIEVYSGRENYGGVEIYNEEDCLDIAQENCEYGVEWYYEHFDLTDNCCVWKCAEKQTEPELEEECKDIESGLNNETATCYDGDYYSDYCIDKLNLMEYRCIDDSCVGNVFQCDSFCEGGMCQ